jgi:hypothetical protein
MFLYTLYIFQMISYKKIQISHCGGGGQIQWFARSVTRNSIRPSSKALWTAHRTHITSVANNNVAEIDLRQGPQQGVRAKRYDGFQRTTLIFISVFFFFSSIESCVSDIKCDGTAAKNGNSTASSRSPQLQRANGIQENASKRTMVTWTWFIWF